MKHACNSQGAGLNFGESLSYRQGLKPDTLPCVKISKIANKCFYYKVLLQLLTFSKATFVGAKTVKGPGPLRVSTRPAALTAARRVENLELDTTSSAIVGGTDLFMSTL